MKILSMLGAALLVSAVNAHATSILGGTDNQGGTGYGGNATAGAQAGAAAGAIAGVVGSGNSANTNHNANLNANSNRNSNSNKNSNSNLNAQGQQQGQGQQQSANNKQGQKQSASATGGNSSATGGSSKATGGNSKSAGGNATGGTAVGGTGGLASQGQSMDGANQQNTNVDASSSYRAAAGTAYAPAIAPTAPCMGSSGVGAQGMSFGFSVGSAWKDEDCNDREDIRTVAVVLGDISTAEEMACAKAKYREARERMHRPCAVVKGQEVSTAQQDQTVTYTDPFIRRRLGLAPLSSN